ncbi:MAG: chromosome segregation protein SMC, partial [Clostridia bacterium]
MYLKNLEMQGFKSFADKICLEFNSGITGVVGPNGSGKSNISDAVRWVLGEQSIKTLRGTKMEDIIFAGTEHRKPLGFADVSITIDNFDHILPVEYTEVTITRRVFRSGESEYFINKTSCRLKDINELFLDTGIGKDGYSIIGQGRIDEILSNKSEDRRHIFEEASGIMKYKVRKIESERKLEMTKQNLLRINDIITELENQIEPLREQSEAARKYLSVRDNLRELEVNVYIENISRYKKKIAEFEELEIQSKTEIESKTNRIDEITVSNRQKTELSKQLEQKLEETREEFYGFENIIEKCNSEIKINEEKINNSNLNIQRINDEINEITNKMGGFEKEVDEKQKKMSYLNTNLENYSEKLKEAEDKLAAVVSQLNESEKYIEERKQEIMDKLDLMSDKKTQKSNTKAHIDAIKGRVQAIKKDVYNLTIEKDKEMMKVEDLNEAVLKAKNQIKDASEKIAGLKQNKQNNETELSELKKKQEKLNYETQTKTSKSKTLQDMENRLEGYNRSVRVILESCEKSSQFGNGIHGAIAQIISVEKKFENAIEMCLGGALQYIVTSNENDAKKAIEYLKTNRLGRATFLPVSAIKGKLIDEKALGKIKETEGFCGIASELVTVKPEYKEIILNLLGRVIVVNDLSCAIKVAKNFSYGYKIVTVDGDIINTGGSMTGGSIEGRGAGILGRSREIVELGEELNRINQEKNLNDKSIIKIIDAINILNEEISSFDNEIRKIELIKASDESQLLQMLKNAEKTTARIEMLNEEEKQLEREESETSLEMKKYEDEIDALDKEIDSIKNVVGEHQEKHKEEQSVKDLLHTDITDYKISVNSIQESIDSVKEDLDRINGEKDLSGNVINKKTADIKRINEDIQKLNEKNIGLNGQLKEINEKKTGKSYEIENIVAKRDEIEEELNDILEKVRESNDAIAMMKDDYNRIEVKMEKAKSEMDAIQNRMWEEYELTYSNALQFKKEIGGIGQAQKNINELRGVIRDLGPVNVAAIDDYIKTKERFEFMSNQRNDMELACEKLYKVISEMKVIMRKQFIKQFKLINENFNKVFNELLDRKSTR